MKIECNKCGSKNVFLEKKGNQIGIYCAECGKWIKWATKEEIRVIEHKSAKSETYRDLLYEHFRAIEKIQKEIGFPIKEITLVYESDSDVTYEL